MDPILAGVETEFGLYVEGRGAEEQIDDAMALVRSYPGERFDVWDYRYESPRADLRGFVVDQLAVDPEDARFDAGKAHPPEREVRSDRLLPNGARFYNDHGHPEYATPECWSLRELGLHDLAGELAVLAAARAFEDSSGNRVRLYKNNSDFHGASYGTHESYLVPRSLGYEAIYRAVAPLLVARILLCGAGKVGSEAGQKCRFQMSQRAEFLVESASVETLYRRPLFNTRDEPHADPAEWMRLHVISGDANMIPSATRRKVGLVKLALSLAQAGEAPIWRLRHPADAARRLSADESGGHRIELEGGSWTTAESIVASYGDAAEKVFQLRGPFEPETPEGELLGTIVETRELIDALENCPERFQASVDWAAKKAMLEQYVESAGTGWDASALRTFDLEYHNIDQAEGLYFALADMGLAERRPPPAEIQRRLEDVMEPTRALPRGLAVRKFSESLVRACWRSLTFELSDGRGVEVRLDPNRRYTENLEGAPDVESFIERLRGNP